MREENRMREILTDHIVDALEDIQGEDITLPYMGADTAPIMAEAALAVLRGMDGTEAYMRSEGMVNDDVA